MLTRDEILGFKPRTKTVHVPEWNGDVMIRSLTVGERGEIEELITRQRGGPKGVRARMLRLCCINADGSQMFTVADEGQLEKSDTPESIVNAAALLCGMKKEDIEGKSPTDQ